MLFPPPKRIRTVVEKTEQESKAAKGGGGGGAADTGEYSLKSSTAKEDAMSARGHGDEEDGRLVTEELELQHSEMQRGGHH